MSPLSLRAAISRAAGMAKCQHPVSTSRQFSVSTPKCKVYSKVRSKPALGGANAKRAHSLAESLPPLPFLQVAHKTGALNVEPNKAMETLKLYHEVSSARKPSWEKDFMLEAQVTPSTLTMLGRILNLCATHAQRGLGKDLTVTASKLGDASATIALLVPARRNGQLQRPEYDVHLRRLRELATEGQHAQALVLQGSILQDQGKLNEALALYQRAAEHLPEPGKPIPEGALEGLVYQATIELSRGRRKAAEALFKRAALEYDYPLGYYHLAKLEGEGSSNQEVYFLKAAASGVKEAFSSVGKLYFERSKRATSEKEASDARKLAKEWMMLGAQGGDASSALGLAVLLKEDKEDILALEWLNTVLGDSQVGKEAQRLKDEWQL